MTNFSSGLFIVKTQAESMRFLAKIRVIFPKYPDIWAHPDLSRQLIHTALAKNWTENESGLIPFTDPSLLVHCWIN